MKNNDLILGWNISQGDYTNDGDYDQFYVKKMRIIKLNNSQLYLFLGFILGFSMTLFVFLIFLGSIAREVIH